MAASADQDLSSEGVELEHYSHAAQGGGEGLWDWNLMSGAVWYSPSLKALLGYAQGDEFADTFEGLYGHMHADHRTVALRAVRQHLEQQQPFDLVCQMHTRSGELRWFNLCGTATRDRSGRPLRLAGLLRDIAERRQIETASRHAEDLQRHALDALHVAVGVLNGNGEIVQINRSWRAFPSENGLIGTRYSCGEDYALLCEQAAERCGDGPAAAAGIRGVLDDTRASFALTYRVTTPAGERHYELRAQPYVNADSRGAFVIHMDVSAMQEAHAALAASRDFYELILDSIPIHISYVDREQRILYMNRSYQQWFGLPFAEIRGRRIRELTKPERYDEVAARIDAVLTGRELEFEARTTRTDGAERELAVSYLPQRDANGAVVGFFSVLRDVTEQKRLEASLRQAQKMEAIGQLTGGIAHDFNNLLSVIVGNLQLLERPLNDQERLLKQVQTALRAALRGSELTRRLLAFARQSKLEPRIVNVNALIEGMHEMLGRSLGQEVEVGSELNAGAWPVRVDPGQLENCILNLAINARDAMSQGGTLTIRTRNVAGDAQAVFAHGQLKPGDYLLLTVTDTGSGMAPEVAKRAFEPFFTTKETGKGTGLGLSMVYGFLEQSGGLTTLQSELGKGTTIGLYFPRAEGQVAATSASEAAAAAIPGGDETVLVVEDDADVRATAVAALRALGYQVLEAESATAALKILKAQPDVAVLFTDVTLPGGMHGPVLANQARELVPGLKVLFTSGFTESAVLHRGILDGSLPLISKPYALAELARRLRAVMAGN